MKDIRRREGMPAWMPKRKSHFWLLTLVMLAVLFVVFYFFLRNKAH
ncbi:preprotein translocase subunit YajC [Flavisolibacter nicotianae]|nr:hypothetical protein [Flavisolibacter nicotianae]